MTRSGYFVLKGLKWSEPVESDYPWFHQFKPGYEILFFNKEDCIFQCVETKPGQFLVTLERKDGCWALAEWVIESSNMQGVLELAWETVTFVEKV